MTPHVGTSAADFLLIPDMLSLGYLEQRAQRSFKVLATTLLETLDGASPAVFNDLDVAVTHREVLALKLRLFVSSHCTGFIGRQLSAQAFKLAEHVNVVFLDHMLLVLFDYEAEIFYLAFTLRGTENRCRRTQSVTLK